MEVRYKQNILYKDHLRSHKRVIQDQPSLQKKVIKNINKTPLERDSQEVSFKGVSQFVKDTTEKLLYKKTRTFNYQQSINTIKRYYGSSIKSLTEGLQGHKEITDNIIKDAVKEQIQFREKKPLKLVVEGILYPFLKLPIHIADSFIDVLRKRQILPENFGKTGNSLYSRHRFKLDDDDKLNSLVGFFKTAHKYKHDTEKIRSAGMFKDGMKMFDPKSGNYNGVHERALTRIVTGFIPAVFLANDAYNLSRLCDDDPKAADKEKKIRFNQETKRVVSNAYIQLITLGALSKFINASKGAFVTVTVLTTLFTEIYSRLSNGKKIHFISKEEAQKINAKEKAKNANKNEEAKQETTNNTNKTENLDTPKSEQATINNSAKPGFKGSAVFKDFGLATNMPIIENAVTKKNTQENKNEGSQVANKEMKPLLNGKTILTWIVGTIALGYAIRGAKKGIQALMKNENYANNYFIKKLNDNSEKFGKAIENIEKRLKLDKIKGSTLFEKIYNKITSQDHLIKKSEFDDIARHLTDYDPALGNKFETVTKTYQRTKAIENFGEELALDLENIGLSKLAKEFKNIANQSPSSSRKNEVIKQNLEHFIRELKNLKEYTIADEVKKAIINKDGSIQTQNYEKVSKMLKKVASARGHNELMELSQSFGNVFKVDMAAENLKLYFKTLNDLKLQNRTGLVQKYENYMHQAVNADVYNLGTKNRFIVKEVVDLIVQPFKFIWNTITFPYKLATKIEKMTQPAATPKWEDEIKTVSNSIKKLSKTYKNVEDAVTKWNKKAKKFNEKAIQQGKQTIELKDIDKEFAKIMNKKISKAFNSVTMSNISNAELSELAKYSTTAATAWFLIADNYNMVMLKSNGENKKEAGLKAKERALQETSRLFYSQLLINLFNSTFRNLYNSSLFGAQVVNTISTSLGEYWNRKSIGVPVTQCTRDEILQQDYENMHRKDLKGKLFRFMSRLTGKRALTQRDIATPKKVETEQTK